MKNVLVLVVRGLHLGYLGCYGNEWIDAPTFDRLAAEGIVFDQHFAARPDPAGALLGERTGNYHLPTLDNEAGPPPETEADLFNLLQAAGVSTMTLHGDNALDDSAKVLEQLDRGLVRVELTALVPPWQMPEDFRGLYFDEDPSDEEEQPEEDDEDDDEEVAEEEVAEEGEAALKPLVEPPAGPIDAEDDELFLCIKNSYAAAVTYLDVVLQEFVERLEERGLFDDLTLIVTTDHGPPLGEHGVVGNVRPWLHEELVHLPLIVRLPGKARAGRRVSALTQSIDLMPTLLDLFGVPIPPIHGHSLLPLLRGEVESVRPYAVSGHRVGEGVEWMLRSLEWCYLLPQRPHPDDPDRKPPLYVKPDDRWEVNDVRLHHLELAEHMEQVLQAFMEGVRRPGPLMYPELKGAEALQEEADQAGSPEESS